MYEKSAKAIQRLKERCRIKTSGSQAWPLIQLGTWPGDNGGGSNGYAGGIRGLNSRSPPFS